MNHINETHRVCQKCRYRVNMAGFPLIKPSDPQATERYPYCKECLSEAAYAIAQRRKMQNRVNTPEAIKRRINVLTRTGKRRSQKLNACPEWADQEAIKAIYAHAQIVTKQTGIMHHVDHLIPLQNDRVCGLHIPSNLRVVPAKINLRKNNKFSD